MPNPQHHCKICQKSFQNLNDFHKHLKSEKISQKRYYENYEPRHDWFDGTPIPFKSYSQYFSQNFVTLTNFKKWLKNQSLDKQREYCKWLLQNRIDQGKASYSISQFELSTLSYPPIEFYNKLFEDYDELCASLGLIPKLDSQITDTPQKNKSKVIQIDNREKNSLLFDCNTEPATLNFGDYTAKNTNVYIERKSLIDFLNSLSKSFNRFEKEVERANQSKSSLIILLEFNLSKFLKFNYIPWVRNKTKVNPDFIFHRIRYLCQTYFYCQFLAVDGRKEASRVTEKILCSSSYWRGKDLQFAYNQDLL